jgi:hypothetical protein
MAKSTQTTLAQVHDPSGACRIFLGQRGWGAASEPGNSRNHGNGGNQMVSFWWVVAAFVAGECAGVLLMALLYMAGGVSEQSPHARDLNGVPL